MEKWVTCVTCVTINRNSVAKTMSGISEGDAHDRPNCFTRQQFLAGYTSKPRQRGHLIFGLDATASREGTWDTAARLQVQMFQEAATVGSLDVQLVYFRGMDGYGGECKASSWVTDPMALTQLMAKIRCDTGETQIRKVLTHALREARRRPINAVVYVGDACEEQRDQLIGPTHELATLKVPVFMFQEGHDPGAETRFREIAELTHGAYCQFNQGTAKQLAEILQAIATFAVGGVTALERQGSDAARLLLGQVR
jgi:hypothetical protein